MSWFCPEKTEINNFLDRAKPLEKFVYFSGYITGNLTGRALAKEIYEQATKGIIYMVQQRSFSHDGFDYIMVKASKPPVRSLIPFSREKIAEIEKRKGRNYVLGK